MYNSIQNFFQPGIHQSKKAVKLHQSTSAHNLWLSTSPHLMEKFICNFPELVNLLSESAIHNATNSVVYVFNNRDVSMFKLEWVLNNLSDSAASELSNIISNGTWSEVISRWVIFAENQLKIKILFEPDHFDCL